MQRQHCFEHRNLASQPLGIKTCSRTRHCLNRFVAQARQQQRGAGRIANAHLPQQQRIAGQLLDQLCAIAQSEDALLGRHSCAFAAICAAISDLLAPQSWLTGLWQLVVGVLLTRSKVLGHAAIDHIERHAVLAGQHADRSATSEKILHHLPGHIDRISRHAFGCQAMISGKNDHLRLCQFRRIVAHNAGDSQSKLLQHAQRTHGLGFEVQLVLHLRQ